MQRVTPRDLDQYLLLQRRHRCRRINVNSPAAAAFCNFWRQVRYSRTAPSREGLRPQDPVEWAPRDLDKLIADPSQALDVFDFEPVMKKNVPPAHFGYMATGVDDEMTLRANREGFRKLALRPRRLVDVSRIDIERRDPRHQI